MTKDHQEDDTNGTSSTSWNKSEGSGAIDDTSNSSAELNDRSTVFEQKKQSTVPKVVDHFNETTTIVEHCSNRSADATSEKMEYIDNVLRINSTTTAAEKFNNKSSDESTSKAQYINSVIQNSGNVVTEKNNLGREQNDLLSKHNILQKLQSTEQFSHDVVNRCIDDDGRTDPDNNNNNNNNLIVAIRVVDCNHTDTSFLPAAIEFDPNEKQSTTYEKDRKWCRIIRLITFLFIIISISLTIGLVVAMKKHYNNKSTTTSTQHPRLQVGIIQHLEFHFPTEKKEFQDPTTSLAKAMNWMTFDDPQLLIPSQNKTFLQRFVLVHLYFQTTQNNNWAYCYPNGTTANGNTTILYDSTNISIIKGRCFSFTYSKHTGLVADYPIPTLWLSKLDVCNWAANKCDSLGHITTVAAVGLGLNGPFPDKLIRLPFLKKLEIAVNNLTGTIPDSIHFKYATELYSHLNQFQGEFPIQFLQESRLLYRYFFDNNQFTELNINHWPTDMKQVSFDGSIFSQALLDTHIERVPSLSRIDLTNTNLHGNIPVSLWNLPYIATVILAENFLTGQLLLPQKRLPTSLNYIQLERNQITGPIPEEFWFLSLYVLSLNDNKLEGTIPKTISNLKYVDYLALDQNEGLYGTIPTEIGTLSLLQDVRFDGTSLNGTVPIELCYLRDALLKRIRMDCLVDTMTGIAEISCDDDCCTSCCDSNGSNCIDYV